MDKWLTLDETVKLIEFIEVVESGRLSGKVDHDDYSLLEGAIKEGKEKLKNSRLSKLIEKCQSIPANRKLHLFIHLYKVADRYRLNKEQKYARDTYSKDLSDYLKQLKKEVAALEVAKNKQTDNKTIDDLNAIIERKRACISNLSVKKPDKFRPTDELKHSLALSFKSVWNHYTNSEKMDAANHDLAAQFFSELGYNNKSKLKNQEITDNYDHKYMRDMFSDIEKAKKVTPFYQVQILKITEGESISSILKFVLSAD